MPFGVAFFPSVPTGIEVEVPSETLLVDSPIFKCLAWVARVFSKVIFMSMCVFVFELCQEPLRYSMNRSNPSVVIGFMSCPCPSLYIF